MNESVSTAPILLPQSHSPLFKSEWNPRDDLFKVGLYTMNFIFLIDF